MKEKGDKLKILKKMFICFLFFSYFNAYSVEGPSFHGMWNYSDHYGYYQNTLVGNYKDFGVGLNIFKNFATDDSLKITNSFLYERSFVKLYSHFYSKRKTLENWESKVCIKFPLLEKSWISLGIGNNRLFYGGFESGFMNTDFGFGVSYVTYDKTSDNKYQSFRGELWKFWDDISIFTGIRRSSEQISILVSHPTVDFYPSRIVSIYDEEEGKFPFFEFIVGGESREGYYGLHSFDSWFFIHDTKIIGRNPIRNSSYSPFRYLRPPVAWRIKDWGLGTKKIGVNEFVSIRFDLVKYIVEDKIYLAFVGKNGNEKGIGMSIGKSAEKLFLDVEGFYDKDIEEFYFDIKLRILNI